ncbi:cell division protein [Curtobacterium sp. MCJR17_055]|uniref:DivIVA domain-containing protein n=1 Tax=unclassified Curtobacterium TaxID=257496 RepID=UPI000D998359|nr:MULTISPECIES: DivIVA domain-containing protein [unclassified Curtobacterium]PYY34177.1 cell division protein [Curtobacterium sp. MCBD17_029]PYY43159.1 cell division protein [Curtobacterium sp. MCPF17_046]PYY54028.1 cell division protein [Curtobacterium sp. MCJR17_055]PYY59085.1 cell division protein [Curtobacterium sp. MCPF17_015]PZE92578.1 cell division protein [Curtobacterium sp. MCBD17_008]
MALTPEDVVNKRFQPTKFREGYDQDEVDDFLDEIVAELRRLNQENEELRQRLESAGSAPSLAKDDEPAPAPTPEPAPVAAAPEPAPVAAAAPSTTVNPDEDTEGTTNLLTLARRLHEEHVREGVEKRDALIAEGQAQAARLVSEAEAKQRQIIAETENQNRQRVAVLDQERTQLEGKIDELRTFERDYRAQLKSYIQGQLAELDSSASTEQSGFAPAPASAQGFGN